MTDRLPAYPLPDQSGRTWLVTGATNGVGREVARAASRAGARVLLTARDRGRGEALRAELGDARVIPLDLADLASVRAGAEQVDEPVDVLIDNAGTVAPQRGSTVDGFETMMGTNFLGPFAFTNLIAERLRDRVVIVGSNAHRGADLDPESLSGDDRRWRPDAAYARSKLADMLWGLELGRRLRPRGIDVMLAHPGWSATNLFRVGGHPRLEAVIEVISTRLAQSSADGAQPVLAAATRAVPSGSYLGPAGRWGLRGAPVLTGRSPRAYDTALARRLWDAAVRATGTDLPPA